MILADPSTLLYTTDMFHPRDPNIIPLKMEDSSEMNLHFALQKDSEFSGAFNYHLLKQFEHGILKRVTKDHHMFKYTKERFGMPDAAPLAYNNLTFPFMCLGLGIVASLLIASSERMIAKWIRVRDRAKYGGVK